MYKIVDKRVLNPHMSLMVIEAPFVAKKALAGQFIILRVDEKGERIPLTIADYDREAGTVTIIYQKVGATTMLLDELSAGDSILDFVGPLGMHTEIEGYKNVAVIGGGAGCAIAYPVAKAFHENGAKVDFIAGFRNKDLIILEDEISKASDDYIIMTDDGSNGNKGFVTVELQRRIDEGAGYDLVVAIGPLVMMKVVSDLTKKYGIKTKVSLNPIMIDGTGMCGGCRVTVGGKTKFACVDGPEFDGHEVDFNDVIARNNMYKKEEEHQCKLFKTERKLNLSKEKVKMPEQEPEVRATNFSEVALGYTEQMALEEANRCLNCKHRPCVDGCPVNINIPDFITEIINGDYEKAYEIITNTNSLPAVCGRVCPQESQCEARCVRGKNGEPVGIGNLERFVADWHLKNSKMKTEKAEPNGHKVAVVGAGPAGLTCAGDLAKSGYEVTIFEAFHMPGGVLVYGIPEFRLPKKIVKAEIESLKKLGVEIKTNMVIGKTLSVDDLEEMGYEAVFIGSGAGLPNFLNIKGENLLGVFSANEYLTRINLMKANTPGYLTPIAKSEVVAVVGGGNVAMDAARSAKRLGAKEVYIIYRRSEQEMPARAEEVHHAKEEGIKFVMLTNPVAILGNEEGRAKAIECVKMELGEPDASGRRSPKEVEGSNFTIDVDTVIIAIGNSPNPLIQKTTEGLEISRRGCIIVDEESMHTTRKGVFAGGDAVTGAATVILAMGAGKMAAAAIDQYIKEK